jgi:hypothetical protein
VFLLDEVQFADEVEYRSVITALHRATQDMPITLVAAGLPQIPRLTGEARSYAERLFSCPVIASLSSADTTAALVEPARHLGVDYEPEAVELALRWTEGYPFYIQQLGKHAWNLAQGSSITAADVQEAIPAAQATLDTSIYEVRIQRATHEERRYMRAMAELGAGPYKSGAVAAKLGRRTSEVSMIRQRLSTRASCMPPRTTDTSTSPSRGSASSWPGTCPTALPDDGANQAILPSNLARAALSRPRPAGVRMQRHRG